MAPHLAIVQRLFEVPGRPPSTTTALVTGAAACHRHLLRCVAARAGEDSPVRLIVRGTGAGAIGESDRQLKDFKTELQEQLQAKHLGRAEYLLASETGPDHQKLFTVEVIIDGDSVARGVGLTKKAAEQAAARQALERVWSRQEESI